PSISGEGRLGMLWVFDAEYRVHQRREISKSDTPHRAVELIERPRFAALQGRDPRKVPVVGDVGGKVVLLDRIGNIHLEVRGEDVGAIEVRGSPGIAQPLRIIAGEEEADIALLIESVTPCVASADLEVMRQPLLHVRLKSIVG